jgi:hypothetical protein
MEKSVCDFGKLKTKKDGYRDVCKTCRNLSEKKYIGDNTRLAKKKWRDNNKDKIRENYEKNRDVRLNYQKEYRLNNPEIIRLRKQKHYNDNKETILLKTKEYRSKNKEKRNKHEQNKRKNDPIYTLKCNLRSRTSSYLSKRLITKNNKTFEIVGCTPQELKDYLEKQFKEGMTWENYGFYGWHIDHIIPLASAETEEELLKLFHYTNLQPLWAEENLLKSNKITPTNDNAPTDNTEQTNNNPTE